MTSYLMRYETKGFDWALKDGHIIIESIVSGLKVGLFNTRDFCLIIDK